MREILTFVALALAGCNSAMQLPQRSMITEDMPESKQLWGGLSLRLPAGWQLGEIDEHNRLLRPLRSDRDAFVRLHVESLACCLIGVGLNKSRPSHDVCTRTVPDWPQGLPPADLPRDVSAGMATGQQWRVKAASSPADPGHIWLIRSFAGPRYRLTAYAAWGQTDASAVDAAEVMDSLRILWPAWRIDSDAAFIDEASRCRRSEQEASPALEDQEGPSIAPTRKATP